MKTWTDERFETLKTMWLAGSSATEIAHHLGGTTRNAVIGKVNRHGLQRQCAAPPSGAGARVRQKLTTPTISGERRVRKPPPAKLGAPMPKRDASPLRCVEVEPKRVGFIDREKDECAFILDGDGPVMCCGLPVVRGSWCEAHAGITSNGAGKPIKLGGKHRTPAAPVEEAVEDLTTIFGTAA